MFEELFQNPDFQPDLLKIYPCALLKEAPLYKLWKKKQYKPYTQSQLINLIKSIKKKIPYYVRIQRITRDIPSQRIVAGAAKSLTYAKLLPKRKKKAGNVNASDAGKLEKIIIQKKNLSFSPRLSSLGRKRNIFEF